MKLTFAGGAGEIGASCIYFSACGKGLLMDAGIRQSANKDKLPDFRSIQIQGNIDAIVISHAHMDHIGSLPMISKQYPNAPIYMTMMTKELSRVLLYDSLKIMGQREEEIPIYNEQDVLDMMNRIRIIKYMTPVEISDHIKVTFYPAGHIAGAACIYIETEDGALFYSGDYSLFSQRTVEGARVPKLRPDIAITEATYGNRLHANRQAEENRLISTLNECIQEGKKILIPAFALGRSQEVLLIIKNAMASGKMPKVPVFVDGMVRDINIAYANHPLFLRGYLAKRILNGDDPFYSDEIKAVDNHADRNTLMENIKGSCIIVSSSGMLSGGPSVTYASKLVSDENACIILTGYQDEESPGRALMALAEGTEHTISLNGTVYPVKCRVEMVGLSAHADKMELVSLMDQITPRNIILVHGDQDAIASLSDDLAQDYRRRIYVPEAGETVNIDIRNKRKQLSFQFEHIFTGSLEDEKGLSLFRQFWNTNYPRRAFTMDQIAELTGRKNVVEDDLQNIQELLLGSGYFKRDMKRMFMIRPMEDEEILEYRKKNEIKVQDVEAFVKEILKDIDIRKLSYYPEQKLVTVTVDFPDVMEENVFTDANQKLGEKYGWSLKLNDIVNFNAATALIQGMYFGRVEKISYFTDKKAFSVRISEIKESDQEIKKDLEERIGWQILLNEQPGESSTIKKKAEDTAFVPKGSNKPIEQNAAMMIIESVFYDVKQKPYKKSIKNDGIGRYFELSFISPSVGKRYEETIQEAADKTGWRMKISDKVNQNAILSIASSLCIQYGFPVSKTPSYLPSENVIMVQTGMADPFPEEMTKKFLEETGMKLGKKM